MINSNGREKLIKDGDFKSTCTPNKYKDDNGNTLKFNGGSVIVNELGVYTNRTDAQNSRLLKK